jgi:hypothetical protein
MDERTFESLVLGFLNGEILDFEKNDLFSITIKLKDVNFKKEGVEWNTALKNQLKEQGYDVHFNFSDGNWATITNQCIKLKKTRSFACFKLFSFFRKFYYFIQGNILFFINFNSLILSKYTIITYR